MVLCTVFSDDLRYLFFNFFIDGLNNFSGRHVSAIWARHHQTTHLKDRGMKLFEQYSSPDSKKDTQSH